MSICFEKNEERYESFVTEFQKFPATALLTYQTKRHKMTAMLSNTHLFFTLHNQSFILNFLVNPIIGLVRFTTIKIT